MKYLHATSVKRTRNFRYVDWAYLGRAVSDPPMIPVTTPKEAKAVSHIIGATDAPSKQKEDVITHNRFTLLRLDLDDTELELQAVQEALEGLGLESFIIHTTAAHQYENNGNRYRVYIELAEAIDLETWQALETYLSYVFMADDCAGRPQQIMYLPCLFYGSEYQYHINRGGAFFVPGSKLLADSLAFLAEQEEKQQAIQRAEADKLIVREPERLIGGQLSIIDAVNSACSWESLLAHYGYKQQGRAWLPPESSSKTAGAYILTGHDGKQRYYSHHQNDPCAVGRCLDMFDFLAFRVFGGDTKATIKHLAETQFRHIDLHNKQEYLKHRSLERMRNERL